MTIRQRIEKRRIGILGMARSGLAAARLAKTFGGEPFVSDAAPRERLREVVAKLEAAGIPYETDGHTDRLLTSDYLVISPGVALNADILVRARKQGIPVFSELEFASWICRGELIAITGTNGKTTTTTLIGEIIRASGRPTFVCGNIGLAFTEIADQVPHEGVAVVEVSSFQLEAIADFHPQIAVILNITPDHLDRHSSMDEYRRTKFRISENQTSRDFFVLNHEDADSMSHGVTTEATRVLFSTRESDTVNTFVENGWLCVRLESRVSRVIKCAEIGITGPHNLQNAAAAALVAMLAGVKAETIAQVLRKFPGVEHRLEKVGTVAGVSFINDSKATNVDSVCVALRAMTTPVYLICGGRDKGSSYAPIIEAGKQRIRNLIVIGEAREKIFAELGRAFPVEFADSLEQAVTRAFELAHPGETVLLSPGCSSFDMFENFEHRGRAFKAAVASLKNGKRKNEAVPS